MNPWIIRKTWFSVCCAAWVGLATGCGNLEAQGTSTEIPSAELLVQDSAGRALGGARAWVVLGETWRGSAKTEDFVVDSARTDSKGHLRIAVPQGTHLWIEDSSGRTGRWLSKAVRGTLRLEGLQSMRWTEIPAEKAFGRWRMQGFPQVYSSEDLRRGILRAPVPTVLWYQERPGEPWVEASWFGGQDSVWEMPRWVEPGLYLEDFERNVGDVGVRAERSHALDPWTKQGLWTLVTDADKGLQSQIVPETALLEMGFGTALREDPEQGRILSVTFQLDTLPGAYGALKGNVANYGRSSADWSTLEAIEVVVRGQGTMRLALASDRLRALYPVSEHGADLGVNFELPNTWTRLRFAVSALRPGPGSLPERDGLRWEDCRTGVRELILGTWANPGDTVRFELAEIRLLGLTSRSYAP